MIEVARSVPSVELKEDQLVWDPSDCKPAPKDRILDKFCNLLDAKPGRFLTFAKNYGVLGLCPHDFPAGGCPTTSCFGWEYKQIEAIRSGEEVSRLGPNYTMRESIERWRYFVHWVRAIRLAGRAVHRPDLYQLSQNDKTAVLYSGLELQWDPDTSRNVGGAAGILLMITRVYPRFRYEDGEPRLSLGSLAPFNLLATVAVELAYDLMAPSSLVPSPVRCHSCHDEFVPARRPRSDGSQRSWCRNPGCQAARNAFHVGQSQARKLDREREAAWRRKK